MRILLEEIRSIETLILKNGEVSAFTDFHPLKKLNVAAQRLAYRLIRMYGRKRLKEQISTVEDALFNDIAHIDFQNQVREIFKH